MIPPLLAVHLADGVLSAWPIALGFAAAATLLVPALWRVREEEIPRIGLLTAAFFVASTIHVPVPGTSVHLLLNGLVGVLLGWRAPLAILVGLALQFFLLAHGGQTTLGINTVILAGPALLARWIFFALGGPRSPNRAFYAGLAGGGLAVALAVGLNAAILVLGGMERFEKVAVVVVAAHLPIAVVEAVIVGFASAYLARVKPDIWPGRKAEK